MAGGLQANIKMKKQINLRQRSKNVDEAPNLVNVIILKQIIHDLHILQLLQKLVTRIDFVFA